MRTGAEDREERGLSDSPFKANGYRADFHTFPITVPVRSTRDAQLTGPEKPLLLRIAAGAAKADPCSEENGPGENKQVTAVHVRSARLQNPVQRQSPFYELNTRCQNSTITARHPDSGRAMFRV